ncbi:hypothetical protein HDV57DRAFT_326560 [Trichoderma longibrachiatum]
MIERTSHGEEEAFTLSLLVLVLAQTTRCICLVKVPLLVPHPSPWTAPRFSRTRCKSQARYKTEREGKEVGPQSPSRRLCQGRPCTLLGGSLGRHGGPECPTGKGVSISREDPGRYIPLCAVSCTASISSVSGVASCTKTRRHNEQSLSQTSRGYLLVTYKIPR